jgi:hypothetical protein
VNNIYYKYALLSVVGKRDYMLKDTKLKETVLDDSAEIYKQRQDESEKQKLRNMNFQEKVQYLKNYYAFKTIVILAIIALGGYFIYSIVSPKPENVLYTAIVDYAMDDETAQTVQTDMEKKLNLNKDTQEIMFDTSFYLGGDTAASSVESTTDTALSSTSSNSEYTMASQQKLMTYLYAGEIDVLIAPESSFAQYAAIGYFSKLSDELPTDLFTALSDSYYNTTTEDDTSSSAYGIYLDGAKIYDKSGELIDRPVLGIVVNSKNKENAIELVRYLFNLY